MKFRIMDKRKEHRARREKGEGHADFQNEPPPYDVYFDTNG